MKGISRLVSWSLQKSSNRYTWCLVIPKIQYRTPCFVIIKAFEKEKNKSIMNGLSLRTTVHLIINVTEPELSNNSVSTEA